MPEIQVTDEQGNVHVFPDGTTPEMIAQAMHLQSAAAAAPPKPPANVPPPPGFWQRFGGMFGLSDHPIEATKAEWEELKQHPIAAPYEHLVKAPLEGFGNLVHGLVTDPANTLSNVTGAAQTYEDLRAGNYKGALGTMAGAGAQAAMAAFGGGAAPATSVEEASVRALPAAERAAQAAQATQKAPFLQRVTQATLNVGPKLTEQAVKKEAGNYADRIAEIETKNQALREAANAKNAEAAARHEAKALEVSRLNEETMAAHGEKVAQIEAENKAAQAEHAATIERIKAVNDARKAQVGRRAQLARQLDTDSVTLGSQIKALEPEVRAQGGAKFDAVRDLVGDDSIPASNVASSVQYAEKNILKGSKESIKQFKELLQKGGDEGAVKTSMGELTPDHPLYKTLQEQGVIGGGENLKFSDLHGYYTELGDKLAAGNLPGDVYKALEYVHDSLGDQMMAMAEKHGAGNQLADARVYWSNYMDTFRNLDAMSKSGSPVAHARVAADPAFFRDPFLGKSGPRGIRMLQQYGREASELGMDPAALAQKISDDYSEMQGLPKKYVEKAEPKPPTPKGIPAPPALKETPTAPRMQKAELLPPPAAPTVDPRAPKTAKIMQMVNSMRTISRSDPIMLGIGGLELIMGHTPYAAFYVPGHLSLGALMEQPRVLEWLTRPQPGDFEALAKLPGASQDVVRSAITDKLVQAGQNGIRVPLTEELKQFLGRPGVQAVLNAQGARTLRNVPPPPSLSTTHTP